MQQSPLICSGILKGAYVNIQDAAPLRNGPPGYPAVQQLAGDPGKKFRAPCASSCSPKIISFSPKVFHSSAVKNLKSFSPNHVSSANQCENIDPNRSLGGQVKRRNSYRMANAPVIYAVPMQCDVDSESLSGESDNYSQIVTSSTKFYDSNSGNGTSCSPKIDNNPKNKPFSTTNFSPNAVRSSLSNVATPLNTSSSKLNKKFMKNSKCCDRKDDSYKKFINLSQENLFSVKERNSAAHQFDFDENSKYMNISKSVTRSFEHLMNEFTMSSTSIISTDISLNESLNTTPPTKSKSFDDLLVADDADNVMGGFTFVHRNSHDSSNELDELLDSESEFYQMKTKRNSAPMYLPSSKVTVPADRDDHRARVLLKSNDLYTDIW